MVNSNVVCEPPSVVVMREMSLVARPAGFTPTARQIPVVREIAAVRRGILKRGARPDKR